MRAAVAAGAVIACSLAIAGCGASSSSPEPTVTVTASVAPSTPSSSDVDENGEQIALPEAKRALLQAGWDSKSPALQREMCTLWATQPDAAWKEFRVSAEASQFTRMNFDVFMALACAPYFSGR